jgi:hypothetical protein
VSRNSNTGRDIKILAVENGKQGELPEQEGYGESTVLSSPRERNPNYPPL